MQETSAASTQAAPRWVQRYFKPGMEVAKLKNWEDRVAIIVEKAPEWDISTITGIPSWVQLTVERIIEHHKLDNIHQLWPNLQVFVTGGIAFEPYRKGFEQLLAHPLIYQDSYLASEGFIAFQSRPGTHAMKMLLNNGIFFEFIPFQAAHFQEDGLPTPAAPILTIDQVVEGQDYALVISTNAGAWRYLIGDTVRFTDVSRSEIIITGRTKHFLSICGEHLCVDNMNQAIRTLEVDLDVAIPEFSVIGVKQGGHFAHHWYIGCKDYPHLDPEAVRLLLDSALRQYNDDYAAERNAMLHAPLVTLLPPDAFYTWQKATGRQNGQSKIPRVMQQQQLADWQQFLLLENVPVRECQGT
ncbi:MAG: GH3 auxin-responsive promoter family protein [Saprospiraceae bacterium]